MHGKPIHNMTSSEITISWAILPRRGHLLILCLPSVSPK